MSKSFKSIEQVIFLPWLENWRGGQIWPPRMEYLRGHFSKNYHFLDISLTLFHAGGGVRSDPPPVFESWPKNYLFDWFETFWQFLNNYFTHFIFSKFFFPGSFQSPSPIIPQGGQIRPLAWNRQKIARME